jgi:hypothetical protein
MQPPKHPLSPASVQVIANAVLISNPLHSIATASSGQYSKSRMDEVQGAARQLHYSLLASGFG